MSALTMTPEPRCLTEGALFARVRRALARDGLRLHRCRWDSRSLHDLGRYFTTNEQNWIQDRCDDLEAWARELGVLRPGEVLGDAV